MPFFKQIMQHSVMLLGGTMGAALLAEKLAAEFHYNKILIQMSDKYNFTQEEVLDVQRNLNEYYIKKDREVDLEK
jgi:precorrin-6x reductase